LVTPVGMAAKKHRAVGAAVALRTTDRGLGMRVLGLSTMAASAAALAVDGRIVAAIEEERLTRVKNDGGFPHEAIATCLDIAGLRLADIDQVAVYWQPWRFGTRSLAVLGGLFSDPASAAARLWRSVETMRGDNSANPRYPELRGSWLDLFRVRSLLAGRHGTFNGAIRYFDHHDCHLASIYYISGFERALCLSYDGGGESHSTVISAVDNGRTTRLKAIGWPNSLGHYYSAFTGFLGFRMLEGEYRMMGLAPHGTPRFKQVILDEILRLRADGEYTLDTRILNYHAALIGEFSAPLRERLGEPRDPEAAPTARHCDVAASVQAAYEEAFLHMLRWAKAQRPDFDHLCIAGGCGLNVTANGKAIAHGLFKKVLIPPAPHDAGCAIGAAFLSSLAAGMAPGGLRMPSPYLGRAFGANEIAKAFADRGWLLPQRLSEDELVRTTADVLAQGSVVAWFQGASEFGPRALGNRSFLADPRDDSIGEALNAKIKKREPFRPFAPSCKAEVAKDFFEIDQESPYMNIVAPVRPDKRHTIPAVTHIDGTARVHTVERNSNPLYWRLLDAFEARTGVGVLLNTSFNIQEPIVESPEQAVDCFLRSSVDWLAIGPFICGPDWRARVGKVAA
jgi:carbamoyltransferase